MPTNGLVVMTPTSIAYSGTSASINADGSVAFSAVTSLSLNGVFTSSYDNYMIVVTNTRNGATNDFTVLRLRASGSDSTTGYTYQSLYSDNTTVAAARSTYTSHPYFYTLTTSPAGYTTYLFGPALTQPTAIRHTGIGWNGSNPDTHDVASTHSASTSYDGMTYLSSGGAVTLNGLLTVFGFNQ